MPIKPENKNRYPKNWKKISEYIRFERADNKCEFCGAVNHSWVNKHTRKLTTADDEYAIKIVLTVAHLDHTPENCSYDNLKALCQKCHNSYDKEHRKNTRAMSKNNNENQINLF